MAVNPETWVRSLTDDDQPPPVVYPRSLAWLASPPPSGKATTGLNLKSSFQAVQGDLADQRYRR